MGKNRAKITIKAGEKRVLKKLFESKNFLQFFTLLLQIVNITLRMWVKMHQQKQLNVGKKCQKTIKCG